MDWTPREAIEAADHPELANHPANVIGLSNAPRAVMNDLVQKHRAIQSRTPFGQVGLKEGHAVAKSAKNKPAPPKPPAARKGKQ